MSSIDERVVQMKFDNAQFQNGVKDTLGSLDKLKSGLNLDTAKKSLEGLTAAGKSFTLDGMGTGIDAVAAKFSSLQVIGISALAAISAKASLVGAQMVRDMLISQPLDGLREYETQLNAIQTILANTQSKGTNLDQVNAALDELNTYADKTIYNFTQMTDSIGRFTAAGVDLDTSVQSIKGLSNVAALSGANATQAATAMYQLSQAIASGTVRLQDWMSIENAGMGGEVFQKALMETARTHGVAVDDMVAKNGSFRLSLQEGWLSAQIMTETLAKFTGDLSDEQLRAMGYTDEQIQQIQTLAQTALDSATKVKTFTQLMGTLAEATGSGWAASWRIILGDFEEARTLFTEMSDILGGMIQRSADARNEQLQIWKDMGGRTAIIDALRNAFEAVMQVITPIKQAWQDVFPPTLGKTLAAISFALRDFTASLKIGAEGSEVLRKVFTALFTGLKFGFDIVGGTLRLFFSLLGDVFGILGAVGDLIMPIVKFLFNFDEGVSKSDASVSNFFDTLIMLKEQGLEPLIQFLKGLAKAWDEFLNGDPSRFGKMFQEALAPVLALGDRIREKFSGLFKWLGDVFAPVGNFLAAAWERIAGAMNATAGAMGPLSDGMGDFFADFGKNIGEIFKNIDWDTVLATINTGILIALGLGLRKGFNAIVGAFEDIGKIRESFVGVLDGLTGVLQSMQTKLKADALKSIALAILMLAGGLLILSLIEPDRLIGASSAMAVTVGMLVGAMALLSKIEGGFDVLKLMVIAAAMVQMSIALNILSVAVKTLGSMDIWELARGLGAIAIAMGLMIGSAALMANLEKPILKTAFAMIVYAAALAALAGVVAIFGAMPIDNLIQGGIAIATMMGLVVGSAVLMSKFASQMSAAAGGLLAMAGALLILSGVVGIFGALPINVLVQGFVAVALLMGGLVGAAVLLSKFAPQMVLSAVGILAMAGALNMLVGPILLLGVTPWNVLLTGLIAMAATLGILVAAMSLMSSNVTGAAAMIAVAAAVLILSVALTVLGNIPIGNLAMALGALVAVLAIMGIAAALLTPVIPSMFALAGAIAVLGLGMLMMSATMMVFALGLMLLGPALMLATEGLKYFAKASGEIMGAAGPMALIGAALIVLGVGAAIAGVGLVLLGLGLITIGAGFALVGATALIGATALTAAMSSLMKLVEQVPGMLALGAGLLVLGAGMVLLGVGALAVGIGMMSFATGLMLLTVVGMAAVPVLQAVITAILQMIPIALAQFALGIQAFAQILADSGPQFVAAATTLIMSILTAIQTTAPAVLETLLVMIQSLLDGIVAAVPMFVVAGINLITGILNGIAQNIGRMVDAATNVIVNFLNAIGRNLPKVIQAGVDLIINFINGIANAIRDNAARMQAAGRNLADAIIDGMVGGISSGIQSVINAAKRMAESALNAAKRFLGIASPSKEFFKLGGWSTEGYANGAVKLIPVAERAMEQVGQSAITSLKKTMSGVASIASADMNLSPTIRPVLDLSAVKKEAGKIGDTLGTPTLTLDDTNASARAAYAAYKATQEVAQAREEAAGSRDVTFIQNNTSPKALSNAEIYRQTNNQLSKIKEDSPVA